jgi:hypothetical protein
LDESASVEAAILQFALTSSATYCFESTLVVENFYHSLKTARARIATGLDLLGFERLARI